MVLVESNPIFFQVFPPSGERKIPLPLVCEFRGFPSPVPTQITSGLAGSILSAPIPNTGWSSKMGVQVIPPLSLIHTPPLAVPVYKTDGLSALTSIAVTRPLVVAGPIDRMFMFLNNSRTFSCPLQRAACAQAAITIIHVFMMLKKAIQVMNCRKV
jgi:hypothetical protein